MPTEARVGPASGAPSASAVPSAAAPVTAGSREVPTAAAPAIGARAETSPAPGASAAGARASDAKAAAAPSPVASGPQIISVVASPAVVHAGQTVSWDVRTTPDIVSVAASVSAYHLPLQRSGPGHFVLNFAIPPNVPWFFHGNYTLDVHGQTAGGAGADRQVSLSFR
ncbi:MAG: hypothetical protein NVSMB59_02960 [Vulcanimicrobiaceae bacterium]